jgi:hypothetical protein
MLYNELPPERQEKVLFFMRDYINYWEFARTLQSIRYSIPRDNIILIKRAMEKDWVFDGYGYIEMYELKSIL